MHSYYEVQIKKNNCSFHNKLYTKTGIGEEISCAKKLEKEYNKGNEKDLDSEASRKLQTLWDN